MTDQAKPIYAKLAEAFVAEGVEDCFLLMGDGNMHWATALGDDHGVRLIHARHEHSAVSMAMSYARASGKVGVASVTCGPGLTQIMTALTVAAHAHVPIVVFAGDSPVGSAWYNQGVEQAPYVTACGAHYISADSPKRMLEYVQEAFLIASRDSRPVVIGVPFDLQKLRQDYPAYTPSRDVLPRIGRIRPDVEAVEAAAGMIRAAQRVIVLGGRGVLLSEAIGECVELADHCGGLLATTLPARGLFDDSPYSIGLAGGFSPNVTKEKFAEADLVIAVGASLTHHTVHGGKLFPNAKTIQIDTHPLGVRQGHKAADLYLAGDAKASVEALLEKLRGTPARDAAWRTAELTERVASEPFDDTPFDVAPGELDPRDAASALDALIPKDWLVVGGSGHSAYFCSNARGRGPGRFFVFREFGVIGTGLSYAIGVAVARPDAQVVLFDGDGSVLMHVQELETMRRHGLKILICVLNDGGYGAEVHTLRADGLNESHAIFGRGDLGQLARGFGLEGAVVTDLGDLPGLLTAFDGADRATIWDIHVSDVVTSPIRRKGQSHH